MGLDYAERTALIADDDEYFRLALAAILRDDLKFTEVLQASCCDEAVEKLGSRAVFALAVFDLSMPGIDAPAALRAIRDGHTTIEKLAVVSASSSRVDMLQSLEAGAHGFVSKGQGVRALRNALRQILDGNVYVPATIAELPPRAEPVRPRSIGRFSAGTGAPHLTPRQCDVLTMLVEGKQNKEIARSLNLGPGTVKVHLAALFKNLGVTSRAAAAVAGADLLRAEGRDRGSSGLNLRPGT